MKLIINDSPKLTQVQDANGVTIFEGHIPIQDYMRHPNEEEIKLFDKVIDSLKSKIKKHLRKEVPQ